MIFCDATDQYYNSVDELIEDLIDHEHPLPVQAWGCKREFGSVPDPDTIVDRLFEDFLEEQDRLNGKRPIWWHNWTNAESISESFIESLDDGSEYWDEKLINGKGKLQLVLDIVWVLNAPSWHLFGRFRWFDPVRSALGVGLLDYGLRRFVEANKHHFVYYPDHNQPLMVDK